MSEANERLGPIYERSASARTNARELIAMSASRTNKIAWPCARRTRRRRVQIFAVRSFVPNTESEISRSDSLKSSEPQRSLKFSLTIFPSMCTVRESRAANGESFIQD